MEFCGRVIVIDVQGVIHGWAPQPAEAGDSEHSLALRKEAVVAVERQTQIPASLPCEPPILGLEDWVEANPSILSAVLNRWIPIPGEGGNSICLTEMELLDNHMLDEPLWYPNLNRLGVALWFYSTWANDRIRLVEADCLKPCYADHIWPYCTYCRRFLLPALEHRCSNDHQKFRDWYRSRPGEWNALREDPKMEGWSKRDPNAAGSATWNRGDWRFTGRWL